MYLRHSEKYGKAIKIIHPGELYVSDQDEIIGTLLGSCIAVCLLDRDAGVAGMNHFMLPGKIANQDIFSDRSARYGITAINELMHAMEKLGARRQNLVAKVFGGGHVLEGKHYESTTIPADNIRLARVMLEIEDVPITTSDVGENYTRKLLMEVKSGKVYLKKTTRKDVFDKIVLRELEYAHRSFRDV